MLVLTRKTGQGIVLDEGITVRVLGVDGDRVRLGIAAPASVLVLREELCNADGSPKGGQPGDPPNLRRMPTQPASRHSRRASNQ